ncbi:hypothetical protein K435DRAFT_858023 [Dendrothele bispora CBS 962.96]|uniref:Peptidase A1 domain-containing protein n=1 Tax=Dendrothele bispora (strain CBS 962.96) TaxID=1314807 RepID=A0A4S8M442_DENBC|nr:hypothetical protein K435DRAFT_858023 [Dendrothele bispora CBS 962.96]
MNSSRVCDWGSLVFVRFFRSTDFGPASVACELTSDALAGTSSQPLLNWSPKWPWHPLPLASWLNKPPPSASLPTAQPQCSGSSQRLPLARFLPAQPRNQLLRHRTGVKRAEKSRTFSVISLYKGDIDFQAIPDDQETYWIQSLTKLSVNGTQVQLPATSGPSTYAAIDTGTTLIGGPEDVIQGIYAQVPGSRALTGYYAFPCDQDVQVSMGYDSSSNMWTISPDDFKAFQISQTMCVRAFFALDLGGGSESGGNGGTGGVPNWIVRDSLLIPLNFRLSFVISSITVSSSSAASRSAFASVSCFSYVAGGTGAACPNSVVAAAAPTQILPAPVGTEFDLDFEKVESKAWCKEKTRLQLVRNAARW